MKLDPKDAAAIEAEVQQPYQEYQHKLEEYEETLVEAIEAESTLSESTLKDLRDYQQHLGLRDEDVAPIEERLIAPLAPQFWGEPESQSPPELGSQCGLGVSPSRASGVDLGGASLSPDSHTSFTEDLGNGVTLEMIAIPGGTFLMGPPKSEPERTKYEEPQHTVTIQPFFIGKFPVTQAQWRAVASFPKTKIDLNPDPSGFKGANRPVEKVSWHEAVEFCARLSRETGREYRLPSEAEWEYACRAGTTTPFHFGETISPELANYDGNYTYASGAKGIYREQTTEVGSFSANAFGLYDMHGNVGEWCADHWHDSYNGAPNDGSVWLSENENSPRLLRGGSWYVDPGVCRSAYRDLNDAADDWDGAIGFRVVCAAART